MAMDRKRQIAMVAATFFLAAATGQYMQTMTPRPAVPPAVPSLVAAPLPAPRPDVVPPAVPGDVATTTIAHTPALPTLAPHAVASLPAAVTCGAHLSLSPRPGAMLALRLDAPCHAAERVVILSDGLSFTELTTRAGHLALSLPAMRDPATVTVRFMGGDTVTAGANVPALSAFRRMAVQWMAPDAFRIDALEHGASFGDPGDISAGNPGHPVSAKLAKGGFLTVLGNTSVPLPLQAQVYSVPRRLARHALVLVEAPVTPETCGRALIAQTLTAGTRPVVQDVRLAMPGCAPANDGQFVALTGLSTATAMASN